MIDTFSFEAFVVMARKKHHHMSVHALHLAAALAIAAEEPLKRAMMDLVADVNVGIISSQLSSAMSRLPSRNTNPEHVEFSEELCLVIQEAEKLKIRMGDGFICIRHLIVAILQNKRLKGYFGRVTVSDMEATVILTNLKA